MNKEIILTCLLVQLLGWQDDLDRLSVVGVRDWVVHQADGSDDLSDRLNIITVALRVHHVAGVAYHERSLGCLVSAFDTNYLATFH